MKLTNALHNAGKKAFLDNLSATFYKDLPADLNTILEREGLPYIIFDPLEVSPLFCNSIREAAEIFWSLATSSCQIFQNLDFYDILDWGFPEDYIPQILSSKIPPSEMRLDIAVNPKAFKANQFRMADFKILEANAATPGFWAETFSLNTLIAEHFGKKCPNKYLGEAHTRDFVSYLKRNFPGYRHGIDTLYFSFPYAGEHEDILSFDARIGYFQQAGGKAKFFYVEDLVIETDIAKEVSLKDPEGNEIEYLFLHYPNEWLIEDEGELIEGSEESLSVLPHARPWDYLQELEMSGKLKRVPPISSELIQNKSFFAFLWNGVWCKKFDVETEHQIRNLIPQTYCTYEEATEEAELTEVWEKPIYGREGAGVVLWQNGEAVIDTYDPEFEDSEWYQNMLAVYQENCSMPLLEYEDDSLLLLFTVYLSAEGRATGIACRAVSESAKVTDARQGLWLPLTVS